MALSIYAVGVRTICLNYWEILTQRFVAFCEISITKKKKIGSLICTKLPFFLDLDEWSNTEKRKNKYKIPAIQTLRNANASTLKNTYKNRETQAQAQESIQTLRNASTSARVHTNTEKHKRKHRSLYKHWETQALATVSVSECLCRLLCLLLGLSVLICMGSCPCIPSENQVLNSWASSFI